MIIALIGSPLSGKTTLLKKLQAKNVRVFHTDSFISKIYEKDKEGYKIISEQLGKDFVNEERVNRRNLAKWACEGDNLKRLNELIHPIVNNYLKDKDNFVAELPILSNSPVNFKYDKVVLVKASPETIKKRFENSRIKNPMFIDKIIKDWNTNIEFDFVVDTTNDINDEDINNIIKLLNGK